MSLWIGFHVFVFAMLALDLGVFHRHAHRVSAREAGAWTAVWIALAAGFGAGVHWFLGPAAALEFLTGYLVEKALSVDNVLVFALIFSYFRVPPAYQHRVLGWGILGALAMRGAMIAAGAALISRFEWIVYVFGSFLIVVAFGLAATSSLAWLYPAIFLAGLLTVGQFSFWHLPRVYPLHLRGTGESFAANIGGRLIGTSFAWLTATLATTADRAGAPAKVAMVAAAVGFCVYLAGFAASFWLPEPPTRELDHEGPR